MADEVGGARNLATDFTAPAQAGEVGDVWHFIELRGRGHQHFNAVKDFVKDCLKLDGAEAALGRSRNSPDGYGDYLMVRHESHIKGAFVYVTPSSGKLAFRLSRNAVEGRQHAIPVETKDENYQVRINLKTADALAEALEFAKEAHAGVRP